MSNAPDGVELTDPAQSDAQKFDSSTSSTEVTPQEETQDYSLVAVAGDQRSDPKSVHVSTHAAGEAVSPHVTVNPPSQTPQSKNNVHVLLKLPSGALAANYKFKITLMGNPDAEEDDSQHFEGKIGPDGVLSTNVPASVTGAFGLLQLFDLRGQEAWAGKVQFVEPPEIAGGPEPSRGSGQNA